MGHDVHHEKRAFGGFFSSLIGRAGGASRSAGGYLAGNPFTAAQGNVLSAQGAQMGNAATALRGGASGAASDVGQGGLARSMKSGPSGKSVSASMKSTTMGSAADAMSKGPASARPSWNEFVAKSSVPSSKNRIGSPWQGYSDYKSNF